MTHHSIRSSLLEEIRNNVGKQLKFMSSAWLIVQRAQWTSNASGSKGEPSSWGGLGWLQTVSSFEI
jgi:hypothetical protein